METKVIPFEYGQNEVRVIQDEKGEFWFVAKDVCDVLGLENVSMALEKVDEDEKLISKLLISGQDRDVWTVSESGLYTLIIRSNKEAARPFRRWVTHEVLPSIRKTGHYAVPGRKTINTEEDVKRAQMGANKLAAVARAFKSSMTVAEGLNLNRRESLLTTFEAVLEETGYDIAAKTGYDIDAMSTCNDVSGYPSLLVDIMALMVPGLERGKLIRMEELLDGNDIECCWAERYGLKWKSLDPDYDNYLIIYPDAIASALQKYGRGPVSAWTASDVRTSLNQAPGALYGRSCPSVKMAGNTCRGIAIPYAVVTNPTAKQNPASTVLEGGEE